MAYTGVLILPIPDSGLQQLGEFPSPYLKIPEQIRNTSPDVIRPWHIFL